MLTTSTFSRLGKALGISYPLGTIISSIVLSVITFFYIFTFASFFKLIVYPLQNRVTYYTLFESYVLNRHTDHVVLICLLLAWLLLCLKGKYRLISIVAFVPILYSLIISNESVLEMVALTALPVPISILIYNTQKQGRILNYNSCLTLDYFALIVSTLCVMGTVFVLTQITSSTLSVEHNYIMEIFLIISLISPVLVVVMISCVPLKIVFESSKKLVKRRASIRLDDDTMNKRLKILLLILAMAISLIMAMVPHLSSINKDNQQIGVDTSYYRGWMKVLRETPNASEFLKQLFVTINEGDRPLSLLFIYLLMIITNADPFFVAEYMPLILGPSLVLVTFYLTRELTSRDSTSIIAAFITAVSYQILIGIYAGFYSNWLTLIAGYAAFIILIKYLKNASHLKLAAFSGLLLFTLFSHVYTWSIVAVAMGLFLIAMFKLNVYQRKAIVILSLVIFSTVVIDASRIMLFGQAGGLERELRVAENQAGFEQFISRWNNLRYGVHTFLGGLFSNFVIFGLGVYWLYKSKPTDLSSIFLLTYLSVGLIPLLFGDWVIQTRVLYNIPFQIPAAIAISYLSKQPRGQILAISSCILIVWAALVAVSNFYLVIPYSQINTP